MVYFFLELKSLKKVFEYLLLLSGFSNSFVSLKVLNGISVILLIIQVSYSSYFPVGLIFRLFHVFIHLFFDEFIFIQISYGSI